MDGSSQTLTPRPMQLLVLVLTALLLVVVWPVIGAVALGGLIALVVWRPWQWFAARFGEHRDLATLTATVLISLLLLVPFAFTGYLVVRQLVAAVAWLQERVHGSGGVPAVFAHLPAPVQRLVLQYESSALAIASRLAEYVPAFLGEVGHYVAEAFLAVVTLYYCLRGGPQIVAFVHKVSPLEPEHTRALLDELDAVAKGLFWGNLVTAVLHGAFGAVGYLIAGVPAVLLLGALTVFASFIPGIGTAVIWIPLALMQWSNGHHVSAVFLVVWGVVVIGGIDEVLRPLLARAGTRLPTLLMFLTIYGGLMIFGIKGLLLGPLFGALAMAALRIVARERAAQAPQRGELVVVTPVGAEAHETSAATAGEPRHRPPGLVDRALSALRRLSDKTAKTPRPTE